MKLRSNLLTLALIGSLLHPSTAWSTETTTDSLTNTCEEDLRVCVDKCDKALADQDKVIELGHKVQATQSDLIALQDKHIADLSKDDGGSILKNPILYLFVGAVVGGFLVGRAR